MATNIQANTNKSNKSSSLAPPAEPRTPQAPLTPTSHPSLSPTTFCPQIASPHSGQQQTNVNSSNNNGTKFNANISKFLPMAQQSTLESLYQHQTSPNTVHSTGGSYSPVSSPNMLYHMMSPGDQDVKMEDPQVSIYNHLSHNHHHLQQHHQLNHHQQQQQQHQHLQSLIMHHQQHQQQQHQHDQNSRSPSSMDNPNHHNLHQLHQQHHLIINNNHNNHHRGDHSPNENYHNMEVLANRPSVVNIKTE